ncbi:hypothetical protein BCV70DRAFT_199929 [Testicularia cyperi]|uniref:Uncharacterized protein n=1 Tax=Testicularia cyperi TaxID=1882483 RepID=A0A317XRE2_9BASI|nr:hypothetical protein BCV70DRAFT_199929 [Testicularia cyperi]
MPLSLCPPCLRPLHLRPRLLACSPAPFPLGRHRITRLPRTRRSPLPSSLSLFLPVINSPSHFLLVQRHPFFGKGLPSKVW